MYTLSRMKEKSSPVNRLFIIFLSLTLALTLITCAVKFTLNFTPLYKFDIDYLKINEMADMSKDEIIKNYTTLISYLKTSYKGDLKFPTLPMSNEGQIHFVEVKNIFVTFDYILYGTLIFSFIGIIYCIKRKDYLFLKLNSIFLLTLPVTLAIPFAINFDATFTVFHKIFFRNDYWQFDPKKDPVINMLPQEFFFHSAVLILLIIALASLVSYLIYKKFNSKNRNSDYLF